jgi:excisionase family DNA binding protein
MEVETALVVPVREAARLLRVSASTVYRMVERGELPAVKIGRRRLIPSAALEDLCSYDRSFVNRLQLRVLDRERDRVANEIGDSG